MARKLDYGDERTPVVRAVVQRPSGEILALRKSSNSKWELPGGKIENDENRFEAAKRELKEETGLETEDFSDLARVEIEDGKQGCANAYIVHSKLEDNPEVSLSVEHDKMRWVRAEKYKELEFHRHSVYSIPTVENLETYLNE
jgi:8-oxo-dGTP diphosphatase